MAEQESAHGVSVVVPVYNGERTIAGTITALLKQDLVAGEIIIVDDGSTDRTAEVVRRFDSRVALISQRNGGPASARNCGIKAARGEFVAFTDSDCVPDRGWLAALLGGFGEERVVGVGGTVRGIRDGLLSEFIDAVHLLDPYKDEAGEIEYLITANACFRRDVLLEVGMFNELFRGGGGEEPDLCRRIRGAGYRLGAVDDAVVLHHHKHTLRVLLRTLRNYGAGRYLLGTYWPEYMIRGNLSKLMLAELLNARNVARRFRRFRRSGYDIKRAFVFSLLQQWTQLAFLWGYMQAKRKDPART